MAFTVQATCGRSRTGQLATKSGVVETPALLLFTRQGAPVNFTTGNLDLLRPEARALQFNPAHFFDGPSPSVPAGHPQRLHGLVGLQGYVMFAALRDPLEPLVKAPNDQGVQVATNCGMRKVRAAEYVDIISALQPDAYVALADEFFSDKPKRTLAAVHRTTTWLKETVARHKAEDLQALLFASVQGGMSTEHRAKAAAAAAAIPEVDGFSLGGFGMGEPPGERLAALEAAVSALPAGKPRHIAGLGMVGEILDAVEAGVDLVHSAYAHLAAEDACALCFPIAPPPAAAAAGGAAGPAAGAAAGEEEGSDGSKLSMRHAAHRRMVGPLVAGCQCYTCKNHTRAYVYHLVDAHEMLADTLLDAHNTHHLLRFFAAMREAIRAARTTAPISQGTFGEFAAFHRARGRAQNMGQLLAAG